MCIQKADAQNYYFAKLCFYMITEITKGTKNECTARPLLLERIFRLATSCTHALSAVNVRRWEQGLISDKKVIQIIFSNHEYVSCSSDYIFHIRKSIGNQNLTV